MIPLPNLLPDVDTALSLEAEELAGYVLQQLCSAHVERERGMFVVSQYVAAFENCHFSRYPRNHWPALQEHLMEAWAWLVAHGLLAPDSRQPSHDFFFMTRLGRRIGTATGLNEFRKALRLPKETLHAAIAERCWSHFMRGYFDTAIFESYRALEVAVREAAG